MSFDIGFWDRLFWDKMAVVGLAPRAPRTHRHGVEGEGFAESLGVQQAGAEASVSSLPWGAGRKGGPPCTGASVPLPTPPPILACCLSP